MTKEQTHLPQDGKEHLKRQLKFEQQYLKDLKKIKDISKELQNDRRRYLNQEIEKTKQKIQNLDQKLDEADN